MMYTATIWCDALLRALLRAAVDAMLLVGELFVGEFVGEFVGVGGIEPPAQPWPWPLNME